MPSSFPFSRSLSRPFSRSLVRPAGGDADALAYIAAVTSTGVSPTAVQKGAINDFYVSAKADGYYTSLKRLYLPIWGVAAANAIDMITLASGTFVGGVTHGAGFVQGNGSTGYFNAGTTNAIGVANGNCMLFDLAVNDIQCLQGGYGPSPFPGMLVGDNGISLNTTITLDSTKISVVAAGGGVILGTQTASNARALYQRKTSGFSTVGSNTLNDTGDISGVVLYFSGAIFANGGVYPYAGAQHGAYGVGLGFNATKSTAFTLAVKNLWETTSGLTLL